MRKKPLYILPIFSAILLSFGIGYLLGEIYLSWFFIIPAVNLFHTMLPKPPCVDAKANCKYVIAAYIPTECFEDIQKTAWEIIRLRNINPSENAVTALIFDSDTDTSQINELYRSVSEELDEHFAWLIGRGSYSDDRIASLFDIAEVIDGNTDKFSAVYGKEHLIGAEYIYFLSSGAECNLTMDFAAESAGRKEIVLPYNHTDYKGAGMFCISELRKYASKVASENPRCKERLLCAYLGRVRAESVRDMSHSSDSLYEDLNGYITDVKKAVGEIITLPILRMPVTISFREMFNSAYKLSAIFTPTVTVILALLGYIFYPPAVSKGITVCLILCLAAQSIKYRSFKKAAYGILLLPTQAAVGVYAFITESAAVILGRKGIWGGRISDIGYTAISLIMGILLFPSKSGAVKILSSVAVIMPIYMLIHDLPKNKKAGISYKSRKYLTEHIKRMWLYFAENVCAKTVYLPPKYIQYSPDATVRNTSPSDIALYMLCCLAVCDLKLITPSEMYERLNSTLATVEKLETNSHMLLYAEYSTVTLEVTDYKIDDGMVGLYLICLISLCEGIEEYIQVCPQLSDISQRLSRIISAANLSEVGNSIVLGKGTFASLLAISKHNKPKEHWYRLTRIKSSLGFFEGYLSKFGGAAEYYTLKQFLPIPEGSEIDLSCRFCLHFQKEYARKHDSVYGISKAASAEFDDKVIRTQKDFGIKGLGINRTASENTVSPYSAYMMICDDKKSGIENIRKFEDLKMSGEYGFFDAYSYDSKQVSTLYCTEHIGLSVISCANILSDGSFIRRTARHKLIDRASELLAHKLENKDRCFYEADSESEEAFTEVSRTKPCIRIYSQGGYSIVASSIGDISSFYKGRVIFPIDSGFKKCGLYFSFNGKALTPTGYSFSSHIIYEYALEAITIRQKVYIQKGLPCEIREFTFTETSGNNTSGDFSIEGIFASPENIFTSKGKVRIKANGMHISVCDLGGHTTKLFPERRGVKMEIPVTLVKNQTKKILIKITAGDSLRELKESESIAPDESGQKETVSCENLARKTAESLVYDLIYGNGFEAGEQICALDDMPTIPSKPYAIINCSDCRSDILRAYLNGFKILKDAGIDICIYLTNIALSKLREICEEIGVETELYTSIYPSDMHLSQESLTAFKSGAFHIYPNNDKPSNGCKQQYGIIPLQSGGTSVQIGHKLFEANITDGICDINAFMLSRRKIIQNDAAMLSDGGKLYILGSGVNELNGNRISQDITVEGYSYSRTIEAEKDCDIIYLFEPFAVKHPSVRERIYFKKSPSGGEIYSSVSEGKITVESSQEGNLAIIQNEVTKGRAYLATEYHIEGGKGIKLTVSYTRNRDFNADPSVLRSKKVPSPDCDKLKLDLLRRCLTQFKEGDILESTEWLSAKSFSGNRLRLESRGIKLLEDALEYLKQSGDNEFLNKQVRYCAGSAEESGRMRVYLTAGFESVLNHLKRAADFTGERGKKIYGEIEGYLQK